MERGQCSQAKPDQSDNKQQQHSGGGRGAGRKEIIGAKRPNRIVRSVLYFTECLLVTLDREDAAALLGDGGARQGRAGRQQVDGHGEAKVMHFEPILLTSTGLIRIRVLYMYM